MIASTKPTTILSIDIAGGLAHIAQVPTPVSAGPWFPPHIRNSSLDVPVGSGNSITFSTHLPRLHPDPLHRTPTQGERDLFGLPYTPRTAPRNNPRPFSPPLDDASLSTLASIRIWNSWSKDRSQCVSLRRWISSCVQSSNHSHNPYKSHRSSGRHHHSNRSHKSDRPEPFPIGPTSPFGQTKGESPLP